MDLKTAAQAIRDSVTMEEILGFYGYEVKRGGFMVCPFHGDADPSLKVYKNRAGHSGWHCFGCGRGGSVIDFVKEHENCSFAVAVRAIDAQLNLHLLNHPVNPFQEEKAMMLQRWLDDFCEAVYAYCDVIKEMFRNAQDQNYQKVKALEALRAENVQALTAKDWDFIHTWREESMYLDYKIQTVDEFREEVAAWRRKRRARKKSP